MPRRTLTRAEPSTSVEQPNAEANRKQKLLQISGWNETEIDNFLKGHELCDEKQVNTAFFYLLLRKIDDSAFLQVEHDLPNIIQRCNLPSPRNLTSLVRYIKDTVNKAFSKNKFDLLSSVPATLRPKLVLPLCEAAAITKKWLFESTENYNGSTTLTNALLLELIKLKRNERVTDVKCAEWIQRLFTMETLPHPGTIRRQWERIAERSSNLRGKKTQQEIYLSLAYLPPQKSEWKPAINSIPQVNVCMQTVETCFQPTSDSTLVNFEENLQSCPSTSTSTSVCCIPTLKVLAEESVKDNFDSLINERLRTIDSLNSEIESAKHVLSKLHFKQSRYRKKNVDRRDQRAESARSKLLRVSSELMELRREICNLKKEKLNAMKLKSKWKTMAYNLQVKDCESCFEKDMKISALQNKVQSLECVNLELQEWNDAEADKDINDKATENLSLKFKSGKAYSDDLRGVYMHLLSLGVGVGKCSEVVHTVLEGLTPNTVSIKHLPAKSTTSGFQTESEVVSQMQVVDTLLAHKDSTLQLDGTKKSFKEYGGFQITVSENKKRKTLSMGVQEMVRGDAESFLLALKNLMTELSETFSSDKSKIQETYISLVRNIKNLLTDRHIVNKSLKIKFEQLRKELFEEHLPHFKDLSQSEKNKLVEVNGLFCGLHVLANMATAAGKALKVFEDVAVPINSKITKFSFNTNNARCLDLIQELSQAFTLSGSQRSGCAADWEAFLSDIAGVNNKLVSFLRHRFNVLFVDGGAAYFHRQHIKKFILEYTGQDNKLLKCIGESIQSDVCKAGLRALGIFAVLITIPLWRVIESDTHTVPQTATYP